MDILIIGSLAYLVMASAYLTHDSRKRWGKPKWD